MTRQLTLIEHERFAAVPDKEFMNQAWLKADKNTRAPFIVETIKRFNQARRCFSACSRLVPVLTACLRLGQVSEWCTSEILLRTEMTERVALLEYFIDMLKVRPFPPPAFPPGSSFRPVQR